MVMEIIVVGFALYATFGDYFNSKAKYLQEQARALEIENDRKEMTHD